MFVSVDFFKTFDISNNERLKAKKIQGKKYEIFLNENEQSLKLLKYLLEKF